jgi:hypothetical protein
MHLKSFKDLPGLFKEKDKDKKKNETEVKGTQSAKLAEIEAKINNKNKDPDKSNHKLNSLLASSANEAPVRPHGPAAELTLDDEQTDSGGIKLDEVANPESIKLGEEIKVTPIDAETAARVKAAASSATPVQATPIIITPVAAATPATSTAPAASTAAVATAPVEEEKKEDKQSDNDSLNSLFSQDDTEENPLENLINALPDVSVQELMDDLAEINRIIQEWRPNKK